MNDVRVVNAPFLVCQNPKEVMGVTVVEYLRSLFAGKCMIYNTQIAFPYAFTKFAELYSCVKKV